MERKSKNLDFSQKLSAKSEDSLDKRVLIHALTIGRRPCASGGDIATLPDSLHCDSKSSSCQNLSYDEGDITDNSSTHRRPKHKRSDVSLNGPVKSVYGAMQVKKKPLKCNTNHSNNNSSNNNGGNLNNMNNMGGNGKNNNGHNIVSNSNSNSNSNNNSNNSNIINSNSSNNSNSNNNMASNCHKYNELGSKLKAELSKYKKELKEYNDTTKNLEEKYLQINYELNEMQHKHERFVASRKSGSNLTENSSDSSSSGSEYSLKRKYTQVFPRDSSFMSMLPSSQSSAENIPAVHFNLRHNDRCLHRRHSQTRDNDIGLVRKRRAKASAAAASEYVSGQPAMSHRRHHAKRKVDNGNACHNNKENEQPVQSAALSPVPLATLTLPIGAMHDSRHNYHNHSHGDMAPNQPAGLKDIYKVLRTVLDGGNGGQKAASLMGGSHGNGGHMSKSGIDLKDLQTTITNLQNEQAQFRSIIQQQQTCLHDYHTRCIKAHHIMQTQQEEIEKLNANNQHLETEISTGIDQLRQKIDAKLRDVSHLPQMVREEQSKYDKVAKENGLLSERLRQLQNEAAQLKLKIDELGRRKTMTINRLKAAERDLKIFKNYNTALKHEKRKLSDEIQKLKDQLDTVQNSSKRTLARQREQTEKQRRDLQKRVFELELKLSRSQNSTTSLLQERDSLIAELQTQLNTLVHNFEVSQKHIRVLRRHIYSMSGGSVRTSGRNE